MSTLFELARINIPRRRKNLKWKKAHGHCRNDKIPRQKILTPLRAFSRGPDRASEKKELPDAETTGSSGNGDRHGRCMDGWRTATSEVLPGVGFAHVLSCLSTLCFFLSVLHEVKWLCRSLWWWRWWSDFVLSLRWIWFSSRTLTPRYDYANISHQWLGLGSMIQQIRIASLRNPLATLLLACHTSCSQTQPVIVRTSWNFSSLESHLESGDRRGFVQIA